MKLLQNLSLCLLISPISVLANDAGMVQLLLGTAQVEREGKLAPLTKGEKVQVGDKLITGDGGLLQLKMSDNALVSLRANSLLHIECYDKSCLKLNLSQGEMRQVTGAMGQANKDKFRLNTPVAAIGVRGTDFITKTTTDNTYVRVLEGAIVAAPLDDQCVASGLGVCSSRHAAQLNAADPFILHLQPRVAPVAQPGDGGLQAKTNSPVNQAQPSSVVQVAQGAHSGAEQALAILKDSPELLRTYLALAMQSAEKTPAHSTAPVTVNPTEPTAPNSPVEAGKEPANNSKPPVVVEPVAKLPALTFASWTLNSDGIAVPIDQVYYTHQATVGDARYGLWRDETQPYTFAKGEINYALAQSQATVQTADGKLVPALVNGGSLNINFDARKLATQLNVSSEALASAVNINANGNLSRNDGLFSMATQQGGRIAGALSTDNQQAAYMLNQPMNGQVIQAITTWKAP